MKRTKEFISFLVLVAATSCAQTPNEGSVAPNDAAADSVYKTLIPDVSTMPRIPPVTEEIKDISGERKGETRVEAHPPSIDDLFNEACKYEVECGISQSLEECLGTIQLFYDSGSQECQNVLYDVFSQCKPGVEDPCVQEITPECALAMENFQKECVHEPIVSPAHEEWTKICSIFEQSVPINCDEGADVKAIAELCQFLGALIKNSSFCEERVQAYLECVPQMKFYCPPGHLVPVPREPNPCEKEALPFAFPNGTCLQ